MALKARMYQSLVDEEGNAITAQRMRAVPAGESPETSTSAVDFTEVERIEGGNTYKTGEYYAELDPGLYDIYVLNTNVGVWEIYKERQFHGGISLLSGAYLGFAVYEAASPVPNDGSYWLTTFEAVGLDESLPMTVNFATNGIEIDTSYGTSGIYRDFSAGRILMKIKAPVNEGAHIATFTQGPDSSRALFRVVDVTSGFTDPIYNYLLNPQFTDLESSGVPRYWDVIPYKDVATTATYQLVDVSTLPKYRLKLENALNDGTTADAIYLVQTAPLGNELSSPRLFTFSVGAVLDNIGNLSAQISLVAIQRTSGSDTVLAETVPITITDGSVRAAISLSAPTGTTHLRAVLSLVDLYVDASNRYDGYVDFYNAKLNVGVDATWFE